LRFSATFRYFRYRQRLDRYTFLPARASEFIANTEALANARQAVVAATDHVLARLALAAGQNGTKPLLLIDGDRNAIYPGGAGSEVLALSALAAVTAARHGIAIIDLHPRFAADWAAHRRRFDFLNDYHWNERGHEVAAATIAEFVGRGPRQP
jgi:hypothetical protein